MPELAVTIIDGDAPTLQQGAITHMVSSRFMNSSASNTGGGSLQATAQLGCFSSAIHPLSALQILYASSGLRGHLPQMETFGGVLCALLHVVRLARVR